MATMFVPASSFGFSIDGTHTTVEASQSRDCRGEGSKGTGGKVRRKGHRDEVGRNGRPRADGGASRDGYTDFMMFFDATVRGQYEVERK